MNDRNVQFGPGTHNSAFPAEWRTTTRGGPMTTTTELRDALLADVHGTQMALVVYPARLDALIAAAQHEARAGLVEAAPTWLREMVQSIREACALSLDDPDEWPHALRDIKGWCAEALAALTPPATEGCECVCHRPEPAYKCDLCESQHAPTAFTFPAPENPR